MHRPNASAPVAAKVAGLRYVSDERPGLTRKKSGGSFRYVLPDGCYIHPAVLDSYISGQTIATLRQSAERRLRGSLAELRPDEAAVMMLLRERLAQAGRAGDDQRAAPFTRKRHARKSH